MIFAGIIGVTLGVAAILFVLAILAVIGAGWWLKSKIF